MRYSVPCAAVIIAAIASPAVAHAVPSLIGMPERTQVTVRHASGWSIATPNANESRPALSLAKLYLGYWVLKHGAAADKAQVEEMIRVSHDGIATDLDARYPQAIDGVARQFRLHATHRNGYWGNSVTSTENMARFMDAIHGDPAAAPLFRGMNNAAPVAADGYRQDFGTATLPGMEGRKFGWSDSLHIHASVSHGNGFTVAAHTFGTAGEHTADVRRVEPAAQACGAVNRAVAQIGSSRVC